MSSTLSYGFKKPVDGDTGGNDFWDDLEDDIQQLNDHTHNGSNSARLTTSSVASVSHVIDTTTHASDTTLGWVLQADNGYKRTIAIASFFSALKFDEIYISWRAFTSVSAGENLYDYIQPTIIKTGISTYDVYVNDISNPFLAVYS